MSRWFKAGGKPQTPLIAKDEEAHLRQVEKALIFLFNDDVISSEKLLKEADSSYHLLGRGISSFIASTLGAEKEMLRDAANILQDAENRSWDDVRKAQQESTAFRSNIYPAGTEYLLCHSVAQLTGAICAVLSGSVVQAISGFAKLRKAFITLDGIMEIEAAYFKKLKSQTCSVVSRPDAASNQKHNPSQGSVFGKEPNQNNDFGVMPNTENIDSAIELPSTEEMTSNSFSKYDNDVLDVDPLAMGITSDIDIFIHSGVRVCFGSLLVAFSMIENPVFTKILYIIGFKGDRERGTRYLWQASRFTSFTSTIAGLTVLMFYNWFCGFSDILPTDPGADYDISGFPWKKSKQLLSDMRKRYPESKLWRLEEARMHAFDRNLSNALQILSEISESNMKQLQIISKFELSLYALFHHEYELTAKSWLRCAKLSNWSPALYFFF